MFGPCLGRVRGMFGVCLGYLGEDFGLLWGKFGVLRRTSVLVNVAYGSVSDTCWYLRCSFGLLVDYGNRLNSFQTDLK